MQYIHTNSLNNDQKEQIRNLWNQEYPVNISFEAIEDFENYLSKLEHQNHIIVENEKKMIIAWYADFIRQEERYFVIIVSSQIQGKGYGKSLIEKAKLDNLELNGWVVEENVKYLKTNGEVYHSPIEFYRRMDFQIFPKITWQGNILKTIKITWNKANSSNKSA